MSLVGTRLLLAVHPRAWRDRYGAEFRALLEASPVTASVVWDVMLNAGRQHARVHAIALRVAMALATSVLVETVAVRAQVTDNVLWLPNTAVRAAMLAALLVPWLPAARDVFLARRRRSTVSSTAGLG